MADHLAVLDPAVRLHGLQLPASAHGLVVLVHLDCASQQRSGQRFIADVLRANGLATLAVTLHPAEAQRAGLPPPGQVLIKHRLRAVFDWLATQMPAGQAPVALLGVDDAVRGCVAAAARLRPGALRSLILLDGRPYHSSKLLARLSQPTLMVVGACDTRSVNRHRAALRQMTAPSRLELLPLTTQPKAAPGAHQAFAHVALRWLESTLRPESGAPPAFVQAGISTWRTQAQGRDAAGAGR